MKAQLFAVLLLLVGGAAGQGTDATLRGTVVDPSGATIIGASVAAENLKTGAVTRAITNDSGLCLFPALPSGVYRVSAEHPGFRKLVFDNVELTLGARVSLNLPLEIGPVSESVEVQAGLEAVLGSFSSSVGGVVQGRKIIELPLSGHDALELSFLHAGVVGGNLSGNRIGTLNITLDGINVQSSYRKQGVFSTIFANVDRIEEFRIVTSPADAEFGRGSGQIQLTTRSGTNEFHGSLFEAHHNTVLNANNWFNNQKGRDPATGKPLVARDQMTLNQYAGRLGGPIVKNRAFFHASYEGWRGRFHNAVTSTVYTEAARRGLFRFYPGAINGNASAANPTVDLMGNPVRPPGATGDLQAVTLFGRDPNRPGTDRSGVISQLLELMPLPNDFRSAGDGLNTAGYTWSRSEPDDLDQFDLRVDYLFSSRHRLTSSYTSSSERGVFEVQAAPFPTSPAGQFHEKRRFFSLALVSSLRPNLLQEFRAGLQRPLSRSLAPWELDDAGLQPRSGGQPYLLNFRQVSSPLNTVADPSRRISPVYQFADNVTWLKGPHALKAGAEVRFVSSNGVTATEVVPRANLGAALPSQNIGTIPGIGPNQAAAEGLLNELAGSLVSVVQAFNSPGGVNPVFLPGETQQRTWRQRELSLYLKDAFKMTPALTLNLGIRYERYGVPYEANGREAGLARGSADLFGISGSSFADLFQPGRTAGSLTRVELGGRKLFENDNNNFAPAAGLNWAIPWFGKDKTVLRMGYGIGYEQNNLLLPDSVAGLNQPGLRERRLFTPSSYLDLSSLRLPLAPLGRPLEAVPLTDRSQTVRAFDRHLRTPYVQNWNVSLQRQLRRNTVLDIRYVGGKGTRLIRGVGINETNIFENGILDAFRITQSGGAAPLLDRIFMGLNIPGLGVVDGSRITGSDAVRFNNATQGFLAGNHAGSLADYLNTTAQFTGERGGLLRRAGLPENFVVANPQFAAAQLVGNFANSTYHALQVETIQRFSSGWTSQANYTWSRALGEEEGSRQNMLDDYRTLRNMRLDKRLLGFHRTHFLKANGIWELPLSPGKRLWGSSRGLIARLLEGWQVGTIFALHSGQPIGLTSGANSWNTFGDNTPTAVADFAKSTGGIQRVGNGVVYFDGLRQVPDPSISSLTTAQGVRARSNLRAILDSSGRLLLVNPGPGTVGNLAPRLLEGPGGFSLAASLLKRIRLTERKNLELRADADGLTNSPQFDNPITEINSPNFGRIFGAAGNRTVEVSLRLNF